MARAYGRVVEQVSRTGGLVPLPFGPTPPPAVAVAAQGDVGRVHVVRVVVPSVCDLGALRARESCPNAPVPTRALDAARGPVSQVVVARLSRVPRRKPSPPPEGVAPLLSPSTQTTCPTTFVNTTRPPKDTEKVPSQKASLQSTLRLTRVCPPTGASSNVTLITLPLSLISSSKGES